MQWLVDLIIEAIGIPPVFINRGDFGLPDFTQADLIINGTWNDLDLSGIIDVGASAVCMFCEINDNLVESTLHFRTKGNTLPGNQSTIFTQVATIDNAFDLIVPLDENRFIQYLAFPPGFNRIIISVKGWWL